MTGTGCSWLTLIPFGGADRVTGACYFISANVNQEERGYVIDCGMFKESGTREFNTNISGIFPKVKAIFITHAHADHVGRLAMGYKYGYRGPIFSTKPVKALAELVLCDSAKIQEKEYKVSLEHSKKKNNREQPLYTMHDVAMTMEQFVTVERNKEIKVDEYLTVCFYNAGHALGSSSIMLTFNNGKESYKLYFSGDIGQNNPLLKQRRDSIKKDVDFVIMESTYAGRYHPKREENWQVLRDVAARAISKGGNVIFPAFSVGRTQEMLYLYYKDMLENDDWIARLFRRTSVIVDSNMATLATQVFKKFPGEFNRKARKLIFSGEQGPFNFEKLTFVEDNESSQEIIATHDNYVVFAASGMCNAGRVRQHLAKDLPNPNSVIILVGYQAPGTLGYQLFDGAKTVHINGKTVEVKAKILRINVVSGHADQGGLIKWLKKIQSNYILFLGHGEPKRQAVFKEYLSDKGIVDKANIRMLEQGKEYKLSKGNCSVGKTSYKETRNVKKDQKVSKDKEVERIRNFLRTIFIDCLDSETVRLINALDKRLTLEISKKAKQQKRRNKPNRKSSKKQRK